MKFTLEVLRTLGIALLLTCTTAQAAEDAGLRTISSSEAIRMQNESISASLREEAVLARERADAYRPVNPQTNPRVNALWQSKFKVNFQQENSAIVIHGGGAGFKDSYSNPTGLSYFLADGSLSPKSYTGKENLVDGTFDVFAFQALDEKYQEPAQDSPFSYVGRFVVTATMKNASGRDLNVAGILTQAEIISETLGSLSIMTFEPVLFGRDLEALNQEALDQLLIMDTPMQLAVIYTTCIAEAVSTRDTRIYNAGQAQITCYDMAAAEVANSVESCVALAPWIPANISTPFCTALSAGSFAWDIDACNEAYDAMVNWAYNQYAIAADYCSEVGIYAPNPSGQVITACTIYNTTLHKISWIEFFAQPDYYEIWATPTTPPIVTEYVGSVPGGTYEEYLHSWGANYNVRLKACKDGECTALSSGSYLAVSQCP